MATKRILTGTVYDKSTKQRYYNATVRFDGPALKKPIFKNTDDDGDYELDLSDEKVVPDGQYKLSVFHPMAMMEKPFYQVEVPLKEGKSKMDFYLIGNKRYSTTAGIAFGLLLAFGLLVLSFFYIRQHKHIKVPLDSGLVSMVELTEKSVNSFKDTDTIPAQSMIFELLEQADTTFQSVTTKTGLDSTDYASVVGGMFSTAQTAAANDQINDLKLLLTDGIIPQIKEKPDSYFWEQYPWRLAEILFWALIATVLSILISTGYYLFTGKFITLGISHQVALLFTVPILALLISIVLSFIKIEIALGEASLSLDLTDIRISILVATFIGLAHWKAWEYMNDLADRFFNKLNAKSAGGENGDDE
jgi:hypothetical protein